MNRFILAFVSLVLFSCGNNKSQPEPSRLTPQQAASKELESMLANKPGAFEKIKEAEKIGTAFSLYMDSVIVGFMTYCGTDLSGTGIDSTKTNNTSLSSEYFVDQRNGQALYLRLSKTIAQLQPLIISDSNRIALNQIIGAPSAEAFARKYFYGLRPIEAEDKLQELEHRINEVRSVVFNEQTK